MVRAKPSPVRSLARDFHEKLDRFRMVYRQTERVQSMRRAEGPQAEEEEAQEMDQTAPAPKFTHTHPLEGHELLPELTDIQRLITDAIMAHEPPVTFEQIHEFVASRWKGMRRKDGTLYSSDCKRAIQANLRSNPTSPNLFRRDLEQAGCWHVCFTIEEATLSVKGSGTSAMERKDDAKHEVVFVDMEKAENRAVQTTDEEKAAMLSNVQNLITEIILERGSCHVDDISAFVKANSEKPIKNRDGDCKRTVQANLSKTIRTTPLFERSGAGRTGWWKLGRFNPFYTPELNEHADEVMASVLRAQEDGDAEMAEAGAEEQALAEVREDEAGEELSELQFLLLGTLASFGGKGSVGGLADALGPQWETIRRPNGAAYTAGSATTIEASLSNDQGAKALFARDAELEDVWTISEQGREFLASQGIEVAEQVTGVEAEGSTMDESTQDSVASDERVKDEVQSSDGDSSDSKGGKSKRTRSPRRPQRVTRSRVKATDGGKPAAESKKPAAGAAGLASPQPASSFQPTELQEMIKSLIRESGGSCNAETIVQVVSEQLDNLGKDGRDAILGGEDARSVILSVLATPKRPMDQLYKRDVNNDGCWMLSRKGLRVWPDSAASTMTLTDLQAEIVQIIALNGGKASIKTIVGEIPRSAIKRRRAGGDATTAVRQCLTSSTSGSKPMFKKDKTKEDVWMVAEKSVQDGVLQRYDKLLTKRSKSPSSAAPPAKRKKRA